MRGRLYLALLSFVSAMCPAAVAQLPPFGEATAIVGARIEVGDGHVVEKGTVLLRDGLIEAVGPDLAVPPDAEVIRGEGLVVFPGFFDACSNKGLKLPDPQPNQDVPPDRGADAPAFMREANRKGLRPELRAVDHLALTDGDLNPYRKAGFTTALIAASGGMINGTGAIVDLSGLPRRECVVRADAAMGFAFRQGSGAPGPPGYPGTLLGIFAQLRQTFLDARRYRVQRAAFDGGGARRPPNDDGLAALQPILDGGTGPSGAAVMPALFEADRAIEIDRALRLSDELGLKPILCGAREAWKRAPILARRHLPVLVGLDFGDEPKVPKATTNVGKIHRPLASLARDAEDLEGTQRGKASYPQMTQRSTDEEEIGSSHLRPSASSADTLSSAPSLRPSAVLCVSSEASGESSPQPQDDEDAEMPEQARQERHRLWEERVANALRLHQAGILFAFTTRGLDSPSAFPERLRRVVKAGLPREAALSALTANPARILGVERQMGTVEAGKIANVIVMTGDFLDEKAKVRVVFVDGKKFDLERDTSPMPPQQRGEGE